MQIGKLTTHGPYLRVLVYGFTGKGKTHFAGTALDVEMLRPMMYINTDGGQLTLLDRAEDDGLIQVIPNSYKELRQVIYAQRHDKYGAFKEQVESASDLVLPEDGFQTIVIDDLCATYWLALHAVITQAIAKKDSHDADMATLQDYGRARIWIHKLLTALVKLPAHIIVTAKAERIRDESTGKLVIQPLMAGKLANEVGAFFDLVGLLTTIISEEEVVTRRMIFEAGDRADAKSRLGLPGTYLDDPTAQKLFQLSPRLRKLLDKEHTSATD